jgi:ABC-2 type transport system permease protein
VSVSQDMQGAIVDRLRAMDVGGPAIIGGHVTASVLRNAASTVLVFGVALLIGFRPSAGPLDWLAVAGLLIAFALAMSSLAAAIGLLARSPEAANGFTFLVAFLPYASSAFVPVDTMPSWIQGFAENQPVTPVTETLRSLLLGGSAGAEPLTALAWCAGILGVSTAASGVLLRRRTA